MNCDKFRPMLQNLPEGLLTPNEEASLGAHLKACAACRREKSLLALGAAGMASLPLRRPSAGFDGRVLAAAAAARRRTAPSPAAARALNAAASAVAVWMAALAAFARPGMGLAALELKAANAGLALPEALRAARHAASVLGRIHFVPGSAFASLAAQLAAAAVLAGFAAVAAARPQPRFAAHRRTR